jgi:hypothetical protein
MVKNLQIKSSYKYITIIVIISIVFVSSILLYLDFKRNNIHESYASNNNLYELGIKTNNNNNVYKLDLGAKANGKKLMDYKIKFEDNSIKKKESKKGDDYYISVSDPKNPSMKFPKLGFNIII